MNINYFSTTEAMSRQAAELVFEEVRLKPSLLLCTATGSSPKNLYHILAEESQKHASLYKKARVMPLDEWIGLPTAEGSCHAYIKKLVLTPLQIAKEHYFGFNVDAASLERECARIQKQLTLEGPIDVCILGLGKNGHLGFNEPASELQPHCHIANLAPQSQEHGMIVSATAKPTKGLTLGMEDILAAKKIILLVSGDGKEVATWRLLSGDISNNCPATWLWKHDHVDCLIVN
jgi:galactosamine-6-phosphate isomerase